MMEFQETPPIYSPAAFLPVNTHRYIEAENQMLLLL